VPETKRGCSSHSRTNTGDAARFSFADSVSCMLDTLLVFNKSR
jgi:hypothetical protein